MRGYLAILTMATTITMMTAVSAMAREPGWRGVVIAQGAERERLQSTPITQRPYRPLHIYGNAVRRNYHRGTFLPAPRDFVESGVSLITRE